MKLSMIVWYVRVAVRASMVVKSGLMRVGQKQMDRFSLVIKFTLLSWLTLRKTRLIILIFNDVMCCRRGNASQPGINTDNTTHFAYRGEKKVFDEGATSYKSVALGHFDGVVFVLNIIYVLAKSIFLPPKKSLSARSGLRHNNNATRFGFGETRERKQFNGLTRGAYANGNTSNGSNIRHCYLK